MNKAFFCLSFIGNISFASDSFLFSAENDFINGQDNHLTNSMEFSFLFEKPFYIFDAYGLKLKHNTYTSQDIKIVDKTKFDSPYAGYLEGAFFGYQILQNDYLQGFGINFGTVGKYSFAKDLQNIFHEITNKSVPKGWDYQIGNKTTYGISYDFVKNIPVKGVENNNLVLSGNINLQYTNFEKKYSIGALVRYGDFSEEGFYSMFNKNVSQVNFQNKKGWSVYAGMGYSYLDYFYILDNFKYEYNIDIGKDILTFDMGFDYFTGDSVFRVNLKNSEFDSNKEYWKKQWLGVSYGFKF